jgi:hypothetical protein
MKDCKGAFLAFWPHPPKVTTVEHEVICLEHEGMVGQPGIAWLVVLNWE